MASLTLARFQFKAVTHPRARAGYGVLGGKHAGVPRGHMFTRVRECALSLSGRTFGQDSLRGKRTLGADRQRGVRRVTPPSAGWSWARLALVGLLVATAGTASAVAGGGRPASECAALHTDVAYADGVYNALAQKQDAWGNELLASPGGPTYAGVAGRLHPLMLVGRPAGLKPTRLTDSGIYYLPFGQPHGAGGAGEIDLHVADGSQIVSELANGPRLTVSVGERGSERYGYCLARLGTPSLAEGYLPILETSYVDADGVRYRQESFAARIPQTRSLVSFLRLSVDPGDARVRQASLRFTPSDRHLRRVGTQLRLDTRARVLFSKGARFDGSSLVFGARQPRIVYVAWLEEPGRTKPVRLDRATYERARSSLAAYWARRLAGGAELVVPEQRVYDAERNLLIQNLLMSWRYSLGNSYERFSWELPDVAEVMGSYGFRGVERAILEAALQAPSLFPNRAAGERMTASADYIRRFDDRAYVAQVTPGFRRDVESFGRQVDAGLVSLLNRERYGSDIVGPIYGLHAQVLALQGLQAMAGVWARTGYPQLAYAATATATRLEAGLRGAVAAAETALPDGSRFVPIALVDGKEQPYDQLSASKRGSYWNLVMPYVLASGFFRPGGAEAVGLLRYLENHGARFLGLVRFSPHTGVTNPGYQTPGSDDVYGTNVARFLADNDQPDQLLLSLYGKLGAGMTENTFVSGEGSTIAPAGGRYYRSMHRPPNSANNAFFLETLLLTLVHEMTDASGLPRGLELAYSTPRAWLEPGKRVDVRHMQTSFGPLSYSLDAGASAVRVQLDVPEGLTGPLHLRLRLPRGEQLGEITVDGEPFDRFFDPETIDLTGLTGHLELVVQRVESPAAASTARR
ncbi:MAG: hypothetical protein QOG06_420 [Gaiellaceae bacterium]|nr:hypothetical protein [Gaiellaceae bacterium]